MSCTLCFSENTLEFSTEMMIHFSGRKHLVNPGVLTFPSMQVCLDCGSTRLTIPETELALLRAGSAPSLGRGAAKLRAA
jgi:hypothetical protein